MKVVRGSDDRLAILILFNQEINDVTRGLGVQPCGRLVHYEHLGIDYQKNCNNMHLHLSPTKRDVAIKNAERLLQEYDPNSSPSQNDPSTTVHELVKILVEASKSLR